MRHDPRASFLDMLTAARRATMRVGRMSPGEFLLDEDVQWVVWSQLVIIGEAANRVSRQDQLKHPDIP